MEGEIKINDFVWAKMTGCPPWPSLVIEPGPDIPQKPSKDANIEYYWVYFFGSHNYAWVEDIHIKPYAEYKDKYISMYKTIPFKRAVAEIDKNLVEIENNPEYQVPLEPFKKKVKANSKRTLTTEFNGNKVRKRSKPSKSSFVDGENSNMYIDEDISIYTTDQSNFDSNRELLRTNHITTSSLKFGVLGLGIIGTGIVKNLIRSGHKVNIWNRSTWKCTEIENQSHTNGAGYVKSYLSPRAVMQNSDIVFNCVSDHNVSKKIIQNYFGINNSSDDILKEKGFVEMTGIDPETSKDIRDMIEKKGGRYLEAQLQGSKLEAMQGSLVILTAGNRSLFFDCQSCFKAMGKSAIFLGDVGYATKINLILQLIRGVLLVGLAEGLALAERCGLSLAEFVNIFHMTSLAGTYLKGKANIIIDKDFTNVEQSLQNMQKDMKLGLELSSRIGQPMELASVANEIFKHCRRLDFSGHDASCIYMRTRF